MKNKTNAVENAVGSMYSKYPFPKRNPFGVEKMNRDLVENLNKLGVKIENLKGKTILDAGCGTGELSCLLATYSRSVTGIDIADRSLEYARKIAKEKGLANTKFIKGSLLDYHFTEKYDYIISHMVLHHTSDPAGCFMNLASALKPGGNIIIRIFFLWGRLSPFQKSPHWKLWVVKLLGGKNSDKKVAIAKKLFYKPGHEKPHGIDQLTYLYDNYGVPRVRHHTFGEALRWFRKADVRYLSSNPPMEFNKLIEPILSKNEKSITWRGKIFHNIGGVLLKIFPIHKLKVFKEPTLFSRALNQFLFLFFSGVTMFTILGEKKDESTKIISPN